MPIFKSQKGFTLLEMLLVLVIISVLAIVAIFVFQQHATEAKVQTTAKQMQNLLEAASAYYVDNTCWPGGSNCPQNVLDFKKNYATVSANNPWGGQYTFTAEPTYGKKFQVFSGNLPTAMIPRILALLPNAIIDPNNPQQILTEITVPSKKNTKAFIPNVVIQAVGLTGDMCDVNYGPDDDQCKGYPTSKTFTMTCSASPWQAKAIAAPYHIHAFDDNKWTTGSKIISQLDGGTDASTACTQISTNGSQITYQCTITATANTKTGYFNPRGALGTVNYMYIGYCVNLQQASGIRPIHLF